MSSTKLPFGLYEQVINKGVDSGLVARKSETHVVETRLLDEGDSHDVLAQYLTRYLRASLASLPAQDRIEKQVAVVNTILNLLATETPNADVVPDAEISRPELLVAFSDRCIHQPDTPLSASCLMTGTRQDPSLLSQLRKEMAAADSVDILCSFVKWSGIRILEDALKQLNSSGARVRIITTSYMGATDLRAVEFLHSLPNAEMKISYDTARTRLHAKAYIFHRNTGFGSAYIGSSNISNAALTDGLEWNVKVSQYEAPHLWTKLCATFETYWNDREFVSYDTASRERLREALAEEKGEQMVTDGLTFHFDIRPYSYQEEILERLAAERSLHGRNRNLIVAATGTGKTVVSAFDYARFKTAAEGDGRKARLLFVAHREEILKQSLACFRHVLRNQNFGDLLVGDHRPEQIEHLFVSIQSFNSKEMGQTVPPDFYGFVVVDEFHHAAAPSYKRLLDYIQPQVLLGLTATPERSDELDVLHYFGGHVSAEIRLPDAINRKLLSPFQYFGITDSVDYSGLSWQRGGYSQQDLEKLLTGNDERTQMVIEKVSDIVLDIRRARAIGFCAGVQHASYMCDKFKAAGIPAECLSAESPKELRENVRQRLVQRDINIVFVVDLYNEGVDIPEVDTVLFLRPTESLTVFLQQLGRGLRLHKNKEHLTVLDFVGHAHRNFDFESRFRALIGNPHQRVDEEIEKGFPHLPAGCSIRLERIAQQHILDNIRRAISHNVRSLVLRIRDFASESGQPLTLQNFLDFHRLDTWGIYKRATWSRLCVHAKVRPDFSDPDEERLAKGLARIQHNCGPDQISALLECLPMTTDQAWEEPHNQMRLRLLTMLLLSLWAEGAVESVSQGISRLQSNPVLLAELREFLRYKLELIDRLPISVQLPFESPLELHAEYTREEVMAALGVWKLDTMRRAVEVREGALYFDNLHCDVFLITLNKTEREYSPTIMYEDYAISDDLFHCQSPGRVSDASPTGKRYINHKSLGSTVLLFVREEKRRAGFGCPFSFLGPAEYVSHEGSRPMSIVWRLQHSMPASFLRSAKRLANA